MTLKQIVISIVFRLVSLWIGMIALAVTLFKRWRIGNMYFHVNHRATQPEILGDRRWGNHSFIQLKGQGIKLHYVEKGARSKPLMVCIHGFPECWFSWRHQLEEFSKEYCVVAVDMRGYGDSEKPSKTSAYQLDYLVEDMREFIEELAEGKKCTLVAHDWGGAIAWRLVDLYPHMFQRHISCNAPHHLAFMEVLKTSLSQMKKSWYMAFFQTPWIPEFVLNCEDLQVIEKMFRGPNNREDAFPDDVIEAYKYYYSHKGAFTPPINYYRNIDFGGRLTADTEVKKIKVPTLIIWGMEDSALDKAIPVSTTKYCEDIQLKFVEGASHWVQQEEPMHVNSLIWDYINITK